MQTRSQQDKATTALKEAVANGEVKLKAELESARAAAAKALEEKNTKERERDDAKTALDKAKKAIEDVVGLVAKALLKARDDASDAFDRAKENLKKATESLAEKETYVKWRETAWKEVDKVTSDDFLAQVDKLGTDFDKNVLRPLAVSLKNAQKTVLQARDRVAKTGGEVVKATIQVSAADLIKQGKKQVLETRDRAVTETRHAVERTKEEVKNAADEVKKFVNELLNQEIIVYDIKNDLRFSLNMHTGGYHGSIDLDFAGLSWDTDKMRELLNGNIVLPEINPVQMVACSFGTKLKIKNEYRAMRDDYVNKPGRVGYFASERFVTWFGGESVARFVAAAIIGKPDQVLQEAKAQLLLEYDQVYTWLTIQGQDASDDVCAEILLAALEGRQPNTPKVKLDSMAVPFTYDVEVVGLSMLPKTLRDPIEARFKPIIRDAKQKATELQRDANQHLAYGVAIEYPASAEALRHLVDSYSRFEMTDSNNFEEKAENVLAKILAKSTSQDLKKLLAEVMKVRNPSVQAEAGLKRYLATVLGLKPDELTKWYVPGKPIIDLSNTPIAAKLAPLFSRLPQGNKSSVRVKRLEFNITTYTLNAEVEINHRHSWGSLRNIIF